MTHIILLAVLTPTVLLPTTPQSSVGRWPLEPRPQVVRGFEPPPKPWLPGHRGVDLLGSPGQAVLNTAPGIVRFAGQLAGRGIVVVSHGATRTTYEPVIASSRVGAVVLAGDPIGRLSASGSHCPPRPCLHWGLLRGSTYLSPLSLVTLPAVRLLPLDTTSTGRLPTPSPPPSVAADEGSGTMRTRIPGQPEPTRSVPKSDPPPSPSISRLPPSPSAAGPATSPSIWGSATGTTAVCLATLVTALATLLVHRH